MNVACQSDYHRHLSCARCGASDGTVGVTVTRDGRTWPPTCSRCAHEARIKSARIRAVERVES